MAVIVVGGMIGLGKTSVSTLLGQELNSNVYYESVDDNPILTAVLHGISRRN